MLIHTLDQLLYEFFVLKSFFYIFWLTVLYHVCNLQKYFLPVCGLSFHFLNHVFEAQNFEF